MSLYKVGNTTRCRNSGHDYVSALILLSHICKKPCLFLRRRIPVRESDTPTVKSNLSTTHSKAVMSSKPKCINEAYIYAKYRFGCLKEKRLKSVRF
jgi:hypothetical protein